MRLIASIITVSSLILSCTQTPIIAQSNPFFGAADPDPLIEEAIQGNLRFMKAVLDANSCLPYNEATLSELNSAQPSAAFFVPAQLGFWLSAAILSVEVRNSFPQINEGYTEQELLERLECLLDAVTGIIDQHAYTTASGKKLLYQVHQTRTGAAPKQSDFDRTFSMLDNLYLIAGLTVSREWLKDRKHQLYQKAANILDQMDLGSWLDSTSIGSGANRFTYDQLYIGCPDDAGCGPVFDRISSEGRLALVSALAREEVSLTTFQEILYRSLFLSKPSTASVEPPVQLLPFFGNVLETNVATIFLSGEMNTNYGCRSHLPQFKAWREVALDQGLPAVGPMNISDGNGSFLEISYPPSETVPAFTDKPKIIALPGAATLAGTLYRWDADAGRNYADALHAYGELPIWGPPNYADPLKTGLVNTDDPVYGTLEVLQGLTALLNGVLGGDFIGSILRKNSKWNNALDRYYQLLGSSLMIVEGESAAANPLQADRSNARSGKTARLADTLRYVIAFEHGDYSLSVRYANDDLGSGDLVEVWIDGKQTTTWRAFDTGDGGAGWNAFFETATIALGAIEEGEHQLQMVLAETDGFGVEIDAFILSEANSAIQCKRSDKEGLITSLEGALRSTPDLKLLPNPASEWVQLQFYLWQKASLRVQIYNSTGQLVQSISAKDYEAGTHLLEIPVQGLPKGMYFLQLQGGNQLRSLAFFKR